jgi:uncharacterized membrane protein YkoI
MKTPGAFGTASILLAALGCAGGRHQAPAAAGEPIALADAIRLAAGRAHGSIAVAAGGSDEDGSFEVALLSGRRVRLFSVDAATGKVAEVAESQVTEEHKEFAARLEQSLPSAGVDLAGAVEIALSRVPGAQAVGAQIEASGDRLIAVVTAIVGGDIVEVEIDAATGEATVRGKPIDFDGNSGVEDKGGGPIWRAQDEDNDYVYATLPEPRGVGFWTKADAVSSFDDLRVSSRIEPQADIGR